ncbi:MAG: transcriptional regulator, MerR family, partial [Frankiales bacterium]|nr:transcriptional regulator, MerR family [Frankiales bacterium]
MGPAGEHASRARPGLPVAAVARRLGIAPATLRTWALRYGLGPADHVAGAHRRYDEADLARLETMRRLTQEGVLPVDAARVALAGTAPEDGDGLDGALAVPRRGGTGGRLLALQDADELT